MSTADEALRMEPGLDGPPSGGAASAGEAGNAPMPPELMSDLVGALEKAIRARRLYESNNPVYHGFLKSLRDAFVRIWSRTASLVLAVEEHGFRWHGQLFHAGDGRDNLAFLFFKDGVRQITFLPGFEEEIERFLALVYRARMAEQNADDDMVTLLWEADLPSFQYSYIDALAQNLQLPESMDGRIDISSISLQLDPAAIAAEISAGDPVEEQSPTRQAGAPPVAQTVRREDFNETLYFLEPDELAHLHREVELEWARDTKADVLAALFDRFEDPMPEWRDEILRILRQLLPAFLSRGDLRSAAYVLTELTDVLERIEVEPTIRQEADRLFAELSEPAVLSQLLRSLEEGTIEPDAKELAVFLGHLDPAALPLLLRAIALSETPALQARLEKAVETLARDHKGELIRLIGSEEEMVAAGAARMAGKLTLGDAVSELVGLLGRADAPGRLAAVQALVQIRSGAALDGVQRALEDSDRDVRVTAARGLGALHYQPARERIQNMLEGRIIRDADLTEKIAFFEAYAAVANAESVEVLDRLLNGKKLFTKHPPELRACAAMALGRISTPAARGALDKAMGEKEPVVRNAVLKALRRPGDKA